MKGFNESGKYVLKSGESQLNRAFVRSSIQFMQFFVRYIKDQMKITQLAFVMRSFDFASISII